MRSALDLLVALGEWALPAVWLPVLVWTLAALAVEAALRLRPGHPLVGLGVRRAMLWALPVGIAAALVLPGLLPEATVERVVAFRPQALDALVLPTLEVGVVRAAGAPASDPLPLGPLVAGLALVAVGALALARLGSVVGGLVRLRRLSSGTAPDAVQRETEAAALAAGVAREVRAVASAVPTVPFTFGWRRPVVVVPAELAGDADALRLVLAHEVAHIARGDFAAGVAERVLTALFGWHPLVGALARRVDLDRERATDAAVLAGHPSRRRDYASLLLSFSRLPSPALALGAAPGSHSLTTRITDMNRFPLSAERLRRLGRAARAAGTALFLLAVGATAFVALGPAQARDLLAASPSHNVSLKAPVVTVDGVEVFRSEDSIGGPRPPVITFAVGGFGRFVVADRPFDGATRTATFASGGINAEADGHTLRIALDAPVFADGQDRQGYVRFDAFEGAAPLTAGDYRIGDTWFSIGTRLDNLMAVRDTYRGTSLYDSSGRDRERPRGEVVAAIGGSLQGLVVDAETAVPVVAANVVIVGTRTGAATGPDGRFVLNGVEGGPLRLRVSRRGYETRTVEVRADEPEEVLLSLTPTAPAEAAPADARAAQAAARRTARRDTLEVFEVVEEMPRPVGGMEALMENVTYPAEAKADGVEGLVVVRFVVSADGSTRDASCIQGEDERLCAAALQAVAATEFTAGRQRGRAVATRLVLPVRFTLPTE